jgi:hypothetical protein
VPLPHSSSRRPSRFTRTSCLLIATVVQTIVIAGCKARGDASQTVASVPSRSGDVWVVDSAANRSTAPGALLAFVNGVHVIVLDGDDAYAGATLLKLATGENGARTLQLADGRSAQLVPAGDALDLRFSTGEHALLRKQSAPTEKSQ